MMGENEVETVKRNKNFAVQRERNDSVQKRKGNGMEGGTLGRMRSLNEEGNNQRGIGDWL